MGHGSVWRRGGVGETRRGRQRGGRARGGRRREGGCGGQRGGRGGRSGGAGAFGGLTLGRLGGPLLGGGLEGASEEAEVAADEVGGGEGDVVGAGGEGELEENGLDGTHAAE